MTTAKIKTETEYTSRWIPGTPHRRPGDESLDVYFYDNKLTGKCHVHIEFPGDGRAIPPDSSKIYDDPIDERYLRRFPKEYDLYHTVKANSKEPVYSTDTALQSVEWITSGITRLFNEDGIYTLGELAALGDHQVHPTVTNIPDAEDYRRIAVECLAGQ